MSDKLVQVAGNDAVYLVGGVPPVKYHVSPEIETALAGLGTPKQVITQQEWLDAITEVGAGDKAAEADVDPLETTEKDGTTDTSADLVTAVENGTEASDAVPTEATTATEDAEPGGTDTAPESPGTAEVPPVANPGWQ